MSIVNNEKGNLLTYVDFENGCSTDDGAVITDWNIIVDSNVCKGGSGWYAITLYKEGKGEFTKALEAVKLKSVEGTMPDAAKIMTAFKGDIVPFQVHSVDDGCGHELTVYLANGPFLEPKQWLDTDQKVCYVAVVDSNDGYIPLTMKYVDGEEESDLDYSMVARLFAAVVPVAARESSSNEQSATEATVHYGHINLSRETRLYGDSIKCTVDREEPLTPIILEWDNEDESEYQPEWLPALYDLLA